MVEYERNDPQGRITKIFESQSTPARDYAFGMTYHPSGGLATYTANGTAPMTTTIGYTPQRYWVQSITAGTTLQLTYGDYDNVGNVRSITDGRGGTWNQTFTYDELHRLKTADGPYGSGAYSYDAHGNRQTDLNSTYTYDPAILRLSLSERPAIWL